MPFDLPLPSRWKKGYRVKIREKEVVESPHATILQGTVAYRINLRTGEFMDEDPNPKDVPKELLSYLRSKDVWNQLCKEWDKKYPNNPVGISDE